MAEPRFLVNSHREFIEREGIPIVEGFGVDLLAVDTQPWARLGARGAYTLVAGRGDFLDMYVLEIPPGRHTEPQKHLFEEVVYVLEGRGNTTIEAADGSTHSFEWGEKSLFALPLNCRYQHFNSSGQKRARLAGVTNLPLVLNAFHNEDFVFRNDFVFPERFGSEKFFQGEGEFIPMRPGRHMWETNFVPDLSTFQLQRWDARGGGSSNIMFVLADGTMHAHVSEMPVGTYKKAHRHGPGAHVVILDGIGFSTLWQEGQSEPMRCNWKPNSVVVPPANWFHQHFNTGAQPARYLALKFAGRRFHLSNQFGGDRSDVSLKLGGHQLEYEDEDPAVHARFESELRSNGAECRMKGLVAWCTGEQGPPDTSAHPD